MIEWTKRRSEITRMAKEYAESAGKEEQMTKPKIEDFIPPGWYAAMDQDGEVLISEIKPTRFGEHWRISTTRGRIEKKHAAMFDLSIFGDDWETSLFQKPPEINRCCNCGEKPQFSESGEQHYCNDCGLVGPHRDPDGSKWNRLKYEAE